MGKVSAKRLGIRSAYAADQQNQTKLAEVAAVDQSIQRHAQQLGINPQQVLVVLKEIAPESSDGNPLSSSADPAIKGILDADGSGDKVVKAYNLGRKTSAYLQTCTLALAAEHQNPGLDASFMAAHRAMVDQLKIGAVVFGIPVNSLRAGLPLADTCKELKTTVTSLNNYLQAH